MQKIDVRSWPRREAFEFFSAIDYPFYSVTVPLEVTRVKAYARRHGLSFYYLMIWLCTKAVNSVEAFRIRVRGADVVLLEQANPSFTDLRAGEEQFKIVTLPWEPSAEEFCRHAAQKSARQTSFIEHGEETDALIYFSSLPWLDFTALSNEHNFDRDDTVPRLAWGRYFEENGKLLLHLSVEVNHRTIDGLHLGRLVAALEAEIAGLAE